MDSAATAGDFAAMAAVPAAPDSVPTEGKGQQIKRANREVGAVEERPL